MSFKQRDGIELNCLRIGHTHYTLPILWKKSHQEYAKYATILLQSKIKPNIIRECRHARGLQKFDIFEYLHDAL